jgi:hypothetical protein
MGTASQELMRQTNGAVTRQEFGALELRPQNEMAAMAIAKQAETETNARYLMAMRNRRNIDEFYGDLLKECERPSFASKAKYSVPRGREKNENTGRWETKYIEGPSIRFVEVAIRCFKNVCSQVALIFDSDSDGVNPGMRVLQVTVTDLENNIPYSQSVPIEKAVERKGFLNKKTNIWEAPAGRTVLGQRLNSEGEPTYKVVATEDELFAKQNALVSKTLRTLALRLLPGDIVEEAITTAENTANKKDSKDPDAAKREIINAFAELGTGVGVRELAVLLGHPLDILAPSELKTLRGVYSALRTGETTWNEILAQFGSEEGGSSEAGKKSMADKLKDIQQEQQKREQAPPPPKPSEQQAPQQEQKAQSQGGEAPANETLFQQPEDPAAESPRRTGPPPRR